MNDVREQDVISSLTKLCAAGRMLKHIFVAKDEIVDMMVVCAIAQEPMVIFGEPGTAKSALVSFFCDMLNVEHPQYFKYLLTQFTEVDEVLGVVDIDQYVHKKEFRRFSQGSLHQAKIVFLDEIFRANSAILNALLSIINERIYYEAGSTNPAQVQIVYGAANHPPTGTELEAFYGRFAIRLLSDQVSGLRPQELLEQGWRLEASDLFFRSTGKADRRQLDPDEQLEYQSRLYNTDEKDPPQDLCLADLENCQNWLHTHWSPSVGGGAWSHKTFRAFLQSYLSIVQRLNSPSEQFKLDDRKVIKVFKVVLAHAMYRWASEGSELEQGATQNIKSLANCHPRLDDLYAVLRHTWERPDQRDVAQDNVRNQVEQEDRAKGESLGDMWRLRQ